jgi:hypothetical protein
LINLYNPSPINIIDSYQIINIVLHETSAIYAELGKSLDIINCVFTDIRALINTVLTSNAYLTGALYSNVDKLTVTSSIFRRISSERNGGAVYLGDKTKYKFSDSLLINCVAVLRMQFICISFYYIIRRRSYLFNCCE